jgi:hypothetical protein
VVDKIQNSFFFSPLLRRIIVACLFIAALAIRIYHISNPPLEFHPYVQYRSALVARALYFEHQSDKTILKWRKEVAFQNKKAMGLQAPPIVENLASVSYRIAGREILWIPRVFSVMFWLIGGIFLYLLLKRIISADAAIFSTAYYLFVPFGIVASRSFQPDPLMVMGFLASVYAIVKYYEKPSFTLLLVADFVSAAAILIKFVTAFAILGLFILLGIYAMGFRKFIRIPHFIFILISLIPSGIYYYYVVMVAKSLSAQGYFLPNLFSQPFFWTGWKYLIERVAGFAAFLGALLGAFLTQNRIFKGMALGLWAGYFIYCLIFTYSTYTHNYYHLQLIPIVALLLAPLGHLIFERLNQILKRSLFKGFALIILLFPIGLTIYEGKTWLDTTDFRREVETAREIGKAVKHSTNTIYLSQYYGTWLTYHGELCGLNTPAHYDFNRNALEGNKNTPPVELFMASYKRLKPEYFIVTDFEEFDLQSDLKTFLNENFPLLAKTNRYIIFDLRKRLNLKNQQISPRQAAGH